MTIALSATGHGAMECTITNACERGETILIACNGIWGDRASDMAKRAGKGSTDHPSWTPELWFGPNEVRLSLVKVLMLKDSKVKPESLSIFLKSRPHSKKLVQRRFLLLMANLQLVVFRIWKVLVPFVINMVHFVVLILLRLVVEYHSGKGSIRYPRTKTKLNIIEP